MKLTTGLLIAFLRMEALSSFTVISYMRNANASGRGIMSVFFGTLDGKSIDGDFVPVNNMVLIKLDSKEQETEGGLLLASKVKVKKNEGTVVSTGSGKINQETGFRYDMPVSPNDKVVYGSYVSTTVKYNGQEHVLIQDSDILVKYTGDKLNLETVKMLRDNTLVKIEKKEEDSVGGILLAKTSTGKAKPSIGQVVKVGPGRYAMNGELMEVDVQEGDMIRFRDLAGNMVTIDGQDYSVVRMNDILAKF